MVDLLDRRHDTVLSLTRDHHHALVQSRRLKDAAASANRSCARLKPLVQTYRQGFTGSIPVAPTHIFVRVIGRRGFEPRAPASQ